LIENYQTFLFLIYQSSFKPMQNENLTLVIDFFILHYTVG